MQTEIEWSASIAQSALVKFLDTLNIDLLATEEAWKVKYRQAASAMFGNLPISLFHHSSSPTPRSVLQVARGNQNISTSTAILVLLLFQICFMKDRDTMARLKSCPVITCSSFQDKMSHLSNNMTLLCTVITYSDTHLTPFAYAKRVTETA